MLNSVRAFALFALLSSASSAQIVFDSQGPPLTPPQSATPPDQKCAIQGRVSNSQSGEALKKATIRLTRRMSAPPSPGVPFTVQGYSATSDAGGNFRIEGIEPGSYNLSGNRNGYLNTQYGAKGPLQSGTVLNLRPGQQMTNMNLSLMPQAVITGKVLDEDGDPLSNATLEVLAQSWSRGKLRSMPRGGSNTNDLGEFRIHDLYPGKYFVCADVMHGPQMNEVPPAPGKPDVRPIRTCYPDAVTTDAASPIVVQAGQDVSGIEIHLKSAATYHVRGKVVSNLPGAQAQRVNVALGPRVEEGFFFGFGQTNVTKDNTFDIAGVAPGSYSLTAFEAAGSVRGLAQQPVDVGNGDVNDVVLSILPPGSIRGAIVLDGTPQAGLTTANLANVRVNLMPAGMGRMFGPLPNSQAKSDGTFTLDNVFAGKYFVGASPPPPGTYLKSVRFGSQEMLGKELDLSQGTSGDLEIVFHYGVAEVDGAVQVEQSAASDGQTGPAPSASIVLVPDTLNDDGSGMHFGNADQSGAFTVKNVPPGHYRAYALEEMDMNQLQNPDLLKQLESKGTEVEVKENDRKQVQLPLISSDELHQIYARLGIDSSR